MKFYKTYFLVVFFSIATSLHAEKYQYNGNCKFIGNVENFKHCLDEELVLYDRELNDLYKSYFNNKPSKYLRKAETSWIKFKEDDCDYIAAEVNGGSYYDVIYKACLINKTKVRINDLKRSFFFFGWFKKY